MATKRKPAIRARHHLCEKEEIISRLSVLLIGNGEPEKGFAFKMARMAEEQKSLTSDISEIKVSVKDLVDMHTKTFEAITKTATDLETYKKEMAQYKEGESNAEVKATRDAQIKAQTKRDNAYKTFSILALTLTIIGLAVTILLSQKNNAKTEDTNKRVENLGSPVVTNPRGEVVSLPKGYELKMWPKDFNGDTI